MGAATSSSRPAGGSMPEVLAHLHRERATGVLVVAGGQARRQLFFVDGELRAARSDAEGEKLGSWLVDRGVLAPDRLLLSLSDQVGGESPPLGHLLVQQGVVDQTRLEQELERLALTILERTVNDSTGGWTFAAETGADQLDTLPNITTGQLILVSAWAVEDPAVPQRVVGSGERVVSCRQPVDRVVQQYDLLGDEKLLLGLLRHPQPVGGLRQQAGLPAESFDKALFALVTTGIVDLQEGADEGPSEATVPQEVARPVGADEERAEISALAAAGGLRDHYALLGLERSCTYQQIFDRWSELQSQLHPRRASEPHLADLRAELEKAYHHVEEAFELLSSPARRPRYDQMLRAANHQPATVGVPSATVEANVEADLRQVQVLLRGGDVLSAVRLLERTCDVDPQPRLLLQLARLMLRNPAWADRALEKLRRAVEIDPRFADGWLEVADFWRGQGSRERERKALERALAADPDRAEAAARYRELVGEDARRDLLERIRQQQRR